MVNGAVPALIRVTVLAALVVFTSWAANVSEVGDTPAIGAMPVPLSVTVNVGFAVSLLEIVSPAVLVPMAVGLKVTLIVQLSLLPGSRCSSCPCEVTRVRAADRYAVIVSGGSLYWRVSQAELNWSYSQTGPGTSA